MERRRDYQYVVLVAQERILQLACQHALLVQQERIQVRQEQHQLLPVLPVQQELMQLQLDYQHVLRVS
jgi:hypothetical protein